MAIRPLTQAQRTNASPFSAYFGTSVSQPKPKKTPKGPGGRSQAQTFGYLTGGGASLPTPTHVITTKKKPKKKTVTKNVVSVEPNEHHKDMMCRPINQGDYVLAVQNNRPFPFKVVKLNETTLTIVPAIKTGDLSRKSIIAIRATGGSIPAYKNYRREGWNVYVIPKEEIFMYHLMGNL
jgi:hypothetical protein